MKRTIVAAAVALIAITASAADTTHRYLVSTRGQRDHIGLARRAAAVQLGDARDFRDFTQLDAFALDLTESEAAALRSQPEVRFVEQDIILHAYDLSPRMAQHSPAVLARDPSVQTIPYGITGVHATDAWVGTRGDGVNVAIVDTGIDYNHPDLKAEFAGGYNALTKSNDPMDDNGHGTHVAGTVAATDNGVGVVGVAPNAHLWSAKVLGADGSGTLTNIADGINWVMKKKAELGGNWIINMSLGICSDPSNSSCASTPPQSLQLVCQKAADAGILIFAASGNDSTALTPAPVGYPAAFSSVVAVGAVDSKSVLASFSNQGVELAVVAPGISVLSTYLEGQASLSYAVKGSTQFLADSLQGAKRATVTSNVVYCGIGASAAEFPAAVRGKIALIQRGTATFNTKAKNAVNAGAVGVIIYNCSKTAAPTTCGNDDMTSQWTLIGKVDATGAPNAGCSDSTSPVYATCKDDPADLAFPWTVTIRMTNADGEAFRAEPAATVTAANLPDDYDTLSGTSMATPHAAGVAALVWGAAPNATATEVKNAIITTAHDLGASGRDTVFGFGLVDAFSAAKFLAPARFGSGATPEPTPITGRRILKRG